jgi:hypothetical protein
MEGTTMIDASTLKNKAIVTVEKHGIDIQCKVISATTSACLVELPDGTHQDVPLFAIKSVKSQAETTSTESSTAPVQDVPYSRDV